MENRILPNDLNAEAGILSTILLGDYDDIFHQISESDFFRNSHKIIFSAMNKLFNDGIQIDLITLSAKLREIDRLEQIGGITILNELSETVMSGANLKEYIKIVTEKSSLRKIITACNNSLEESYNPTAKADKIKGSLEYSLCEIGNVRKNNNKFVTLNEQVVSVLTYINNMKHHGYKDIINTGFTDIDNILGGLSPGNLIILAARPSMGKSTLALNIALNVSVYAKNVPFITMEMEMEELMIKLLSHITGINSRHISSGRLDDDEISRIVSAGDTLTNYPIYFNCSSLQTKASVEWQVKKLIDRIGEIGILIVDYLQLIQAISDRKNRREVIGELSRFFKILAGILHIPIIVLSQLNRNLENRPNKEPVLSDLKESGDIEQDADKVIFINREWVYDKSKDPNKVTIIVAKNRQGAVGRCELSFEPEISRFSDLKEDAVPAEYYNEPEKLDPKEVQDEFNM